jgi:hypothetical protein
VLTPVHEAIYDYGISWGSAATILQNFSQRVIKFSQLAEMLKEDGGEKYIQKRVANMDMVANVLRALPLDKEDEFVNVSTSIAGYSDMLVELAQVVSAAADMTMTRLFGRAPAGMNATGEYDQDADHERIETEQEDVYTHPVESALRMVMLSKDGPTGGVEPPDWSVTWNPLKQQSEKEIAETRKLDRRDRSDQHRRGVYTARIAAESHFKGDKYNPEISIDWTEWEKQKKIEEEQAATIAGNQADMAALGRQATGGPIREGRSETSPTRRPLSTTTTWTTSGTSRWPRPRSARRRSARPRTCRLSCAPATASAVASSPSRSGRSRSSASTRPTSSASSRTSGARTDAALAQLPALIESARREREDAADHELLGLRVVIENPAGSIRTWTDADGTTGTTVMRWPYGYLDGYEGADGEDVDAYVGPELEPAEVYVVHQQRKGAHPTPSVAGLRRGQGHARLVVGRCSKAAYLAQYDDPRFFGGMSVFTADDFKRQLVANPGRKLTHADPRARVLRRRRRGSPRADADGPVARRPRRHRGEGRAGGRIRAKQVDTFGKKQLGKQSEAALGVDITPLLKNPKWPP